MYALRSRGLVEKEMKKLKELEKQFEQMHEDAELQDISADVAEFEAELTPIDGRPAARKPKKRGKLSWSRQFK